MWHAKLLLSKLQDKVSFPVYQASPSNDIWSILGGYKDDIFVYDRYGRLTSYVPFPRSYLQEKFVEAAVMSAMFDEPCGPSDETDQPDAKLNAGRSRDVV